ncbi:hypothetical protein IW261DRAFT_1648421 [Armillaria novae-zelandiae]|uniref:DUF6697 domain-containing protein n=1 Tax=Armillaria novae-zelandiae TaxID=153914 RepID=A0AA39UA10_9AGAR|nr:hypothetical protein IW261DRAFT_1648421 [Armillaria novae-zelandiae]
MAQTDPKVALSSSALALWDQLQSELSAEVSREREKCANLASKLETVEEEQKESAEALQRQKLELENKNQMMALLAMERDQISLQRFRQNNALMARQANMLREQANSFANDAHTRRMLKISALHPPDILAGGQPPLSTFRFSNPAHVTELLETKTTLTRPLFFSLSPPRALPICLPGMGHSGYWFDPHNTPKSEFDLLVETGWTYYGRFITKALDPDAYMELAEWMAIDEPARRSYMNEMSSRGLPSGQLATTEEINALLRQVDSGEKIVPCYLLQWVGFSVDLCKAFTDVINTLMPRHEPGYSTTPSYTLRNSFKRSEHAMSAKDIPAGHQADNPIRKKLRLVAIDNNKENIKFLPVGGHC